MLAELEDLRTLKIEIGLAPEEGKAFKRELRDGGETEQTNLLINVATAAMENEYGKRGIPARPAWRQSFKSHETRRLAQKFGVGLRTARGQSRKDLTEAATVLGQALVDLLRRTIEGWTRPPNSPRTIADKGFNDPLISTKQTVESLSARVYIRKRLRSKVFARGGG